MPFHTLLDLFLHLRDLEEREAVRFFNGYRTWTWSYRELWDRSLQSAALLEHQGLRKGSRLILWSENRPEWVALFWACVISGVEVVPLDSRWSPALVRRVQDQVKADLLVCGEAVNSASLEMPCCSIFEIPEQSAANLPGVEIGPDDTVQIVFTSGTTGRPRGIVHRHRNICSNLNPVAREIARYRPYLKPFQPLRILTLLPLSHLFGQSMGILVPPILEGAAVFTEGLSPNSVIDCIRRNRVSVTALVPKLLENLSNEVRLRSQLEDIREIGSGWSGVARRWWRFRDVHRLFGVKFWGFVVGGAAVGPEMEMFWRMLGFVVIQGYGLTESSPVVALNHPLDSRKGSLGKAIGGQTVRLADDGEILVRGDSVASEFTAEGQPAESLVDPNGWLHTGDIGEMDANGRLYFKGRKKEVVVTASGLNVYPGDVEAALNQLPAVRESVVVGLADGDDETIHAVLILEDGDANPDDLIGTANRGLEDYQRIQSWSLWSQPDFPRTPSTQKVKRREVALVVNRGPAIEEEKESVLESLLTELRLKDAESVDLRLSEDLGLSSLDRLELLSRLEDQLGTSLDERDFGELATVGELDRFVKSSRGAGKAPAVPDFVPMPRWALTGPIRLARNLFRRGIIQPLFRHYVQLTVNGSEFLNSCKGSVLFASNHMSHLDTVAIVCALSKERRHLLAPAMMKEYFEAHFRPGDHPLKDRVESSLQYFLACGLFNSYPLAQQIVGTRSALQYSGELIEQGYCPLIYPEGLRSPDGQIRTFRPGVGLMATRLGVPVIPVKIEGTFELMSPRDRWPRSGRARVAFGVPLRFAVTSDPKEVTAKIESAVRSL